MDLFSLGKKTFLITGVANRKSIAYLVAKTLGENGANLILTYQNEEIQKKMESHFPESQSFIVNVEKDETLVQLSKSLNEQEIKLDGMLHSMAFANYQKPKPFHETSFQDFIQAEKTRHFSLISLSNTLKDIFNKNASVVTMSISNTRVTSYGYMGPIKASLDATVSYLAKSFSDFSNIRFNAVCSGPLKTSASSGIPGYIDNYLFAEKLTLRKEALKTQEVANVVTFLLSSFSSGINAAGITVDAGMDCNYFDQDVVKTTINNS